MRKTLVDKHALTDLFERKAAGFDVVINDMDDAVILSDAGGKILLVNPAFKDMFGYDEGGVKGQRLSHLRAGEEGDERVHCEPVHFDEATNGGERRVIYRRRDGTRFFGRTSCTVLRDSQGEEIGFLDVVRQADPAPVDVERMRKVVELAPIGIIVTDRDGRIDLVNDEALRLFGYSQEELLGQTVELLLPESVRARHVEQRFDYLEEPYFRPMGIGLDLAAKRKDGREFPVEVSLNTIDVGGETWVLSFIADVTRRREVEKKLADHAAELEKQNAELDAFAHTVAHDLKTPVALILGFSDLLRIESRPDNFEKLPETLDQIITMAQRLNNIINELLLLSTVRKTDVEMLPLNMKAIVEEAQEKIAYLIGEYHAELILPFSWPAALGHALWIEEIWANYLSNAIKYGGRPPQIELGATRQPDGMVRFWVRDNGGGIPLEDRERLFTPFTQLNQVRARGHGLGLSIVRRIVEKCQGRVGVESEGRSGTTFWFTLPAAPE